MIKVVPWATKQSEDWLVSFRQFQEWEATLMLTKQELVQRIQEWKEVAAAIDRGEHPYNNLTDDLTIQFGKFAHGMVKHLETTLTQLEAEEHASNKMN